jgi:hypothetical protein
LSAALPNWPALMDARLSAAYCDMAESTFRALAALRGVRPVDLGLSVTRWRKRDLDALIDSLPTRGEPDAPPPALTQDPAAEALERARKRHEERKPRRRA